VPAKWPDGPQHRFRLVEIRDGRLVTAQQHVEAGAAARSSSSSSR
jgi:hypothetical protein